MNLSTAIFLVRPDVRAISVSYEVDPNGKPTGNLGTFKTLDPTVAVGDLVVVPTDTRHKMTISRVEAVDLDVDFESSVQMGWLVSVVDRAPYDSILTQEGAAIVAIRSAETRRKREELAEKLMADNPELAKLGGFAAPYGGPIPISPPQPAPEPYRPPAGEPDTF